MEATKEEGTGLLEKILPPRLEDAGLEDCALPPDSIHEAFLKAANAVKSRAAAFFDASDGEKEEGGCVADPWLAVKEKETDKVVGADLPIPGASDTVVVGGPSTEKGPCLAGKGSPEVKKEDEGNDAVVVLGGEGTQENEGTKGCDGDGNGSDGLGVKRRKKNRADDEEEEDDVPVLIEGVV